MSHNEGKTRICDVCGRRLHKVQTCQKCGRALCNLHLSVTRHSCTAARDRPAKTDKDASGRRTPTKPIILATLVGAVAVSLMILMSISGGPGEEEITEVTSGANFSVGLSFAKIQEAMTQSRGTREFPRGGFPGDGTMPFPFDNETMRFPFGNRTIPDEFRNRTGPRSFGFMNMSGAEFLVAIPESIQVQEATSIEIRVLRTESGYTIYGVESVGESTDQSVINLSLAAPPSPGKYSIYYTLTTLSGLETLPEDLGPFAFRRTMGQYPIGDLTFMVREIIEVS